MLHSIQKCILIWLKQTAGRSRYVTDTHVHADYISRTRELAKASMAKHLLIDKAEVELSFHAMLKMVNEYKSEMQQSKFFIHQAIRWKALHSG